MNVGSIDWPNKLVYLHADTVVNGFNAIDAHFEINAMISANVGGAQNFSQIMTAEGNEAKGGGRFTPRFVKVEAGWRFIPIDTTHTLFWHIEAISPDEELSDGQLVDRSGFANVVDFQATYTPTEIVETRAPLSDEQSTQLIEVWRRLDLDPTAPNQYANDRTRAHNADDIDLVATNDGTTTTVQRQ